MSSASDVIMSGGAANAHLLDGSVEWRDVPRRIGYYAKVLLFGRRDSSGSAGSFFFLNLEDAAGLFEASGAEFDAVARFRGRLLPSQRLEEHPVWKSGDDKTVLISIFGVVHEDVTSWQLSMTMRLAQGEGGPTVLATGVLNTTVFQRISRPSAGPSLRTPDSSTRTTG